MFDDASAQCEAAIQKIANSAEASPKAAAPKEAAPKIAAPKVEATKSPKPKEEKKEPEKKDGVKAPSAKRSNKARLTAYFKKHNPDKIDSVDKLLGSYKGKEEELFKKLSAKYGHVVE